MNGIYIAIKKEIHGLKKGKIYHHEFEDTVANHKDRARTGDNTGVRKQNTETDFD